MCVFFLFIHLLCFFHPLWDLIAHPSQNVNVAMTLFISHLTKLLLSIFRKPFPTANNKSNLFWMNSVWIRALFHRLFVVFICVCVLWYDIFPQNFRLIFACWKCSTMSYPIAVFSSSKYVARRQWPYNMIHYYSDVMHFDDSDNNQHTTQNESDWI